MNSDEGPSATGRFSWDRLPVGSRILGLVIAATLALLVFGAVTLTPRVGASTGAQTASENERGSKGAASNVTEPTPTSLSATPSPTNTGGRLAPATADSVPSMQPSYGTKALDVLATIPIKGRAPQTGYDRAQFGQAWADVNLNGCDTRNDILKRDLSSVTFTDSVPCKVQGGILADPYTGMSIRFLRGTSTSAAVQVDHVVALSDAWQKGAQRLSPNQRTAFANDPLNLQATDGPTNIQKGSGDAATWLPPNKGFRCEYVARQISVKHTYGLWVTQAEHDAMARILVGCVDQPITAGGNASPLPELDIAQPAPPAAPADGASPATPPFYVNCAAVKDAGTAPLHAGQPGYSHSLDRDGDGVACEK